MSSDSASESMRVLVVEDDDALRRSVVRALGAAGSEVTEAASVAAASAALRTGSFDVVVCDYQLGDGTALDVLASFDDARRAPLIVVSGALDDTIVATLLAAGTTECFEKPIAVTELIAIVRRLAGGDPA